MTEENALLYLAQAQDLLETFQTIGRVHDLSSSPKRLFTDMLHELLAAETLRETSDAIRDELQNIRSLAIATKYDAIDPIDHIKRERNRVSTLKSLSPQSPYFDTQEADKLAEAVGGIWLQVLEIGRNLEKVYDLYLEEISVR